MSPPLVHIVILNWNGRDDTLACLESVERIDYPNFKVIVADNGSSDGSLDAIRLRFPDVQLIETTNGVNKTRARAIGWRKCF